MKTKLLKKVRKQYKIVKNNREYYFLVQKNPIKKFLYRFGFAGEWNFDLSYNKRIDELVIESECFSEYLHTEHEVIYNLLNKLRHLLREKYPKLGFYNKLNKRLEKDRKKREKITHTVWY